MADGYGFGAEGDWKTAILVRAAKVMGAGLPGGASLMEDYTYHLAPGQEKILGAHMLEVCPSLTATKPRVEIHPLGIGGKEDPVRMVFDTDAGPGVVVALSDMRDRFRLVANAVDVVDLDQPLPNLPVARALWSPKPDFATSAAAWLTAGAAHHTVLTTAVGMDVFEDFAEIARTELLAIDEGTTLKQFKEGTELERRLLQAGRRAVTEYELRAGEYSAVITARAAALRRLRHGERDLMVPFPEGGPIPDYRGIIAAPWPNRIADGRYTFQGVDYQVPVNEPERDCALHGLAFRPRMGAGNPGRIIRASLLRSGTGPRVSIRPATHGQLCAVRRRAAQPDNSGQYRYRHCALRRVPSPLPRRRAGTPGRVDAADPCGFLPGGDAGPPAARRHPDRGGPRIDFRAPRRIGATEIDHAFTGIEFVRRRRHGQ